MYKQINLLVLATKPQHCSHLWTNVIQKSLRSTHVLILIILNLGAEGVKIQYIYIMYYIQIIKSHRTLASSAPLIGCRALGFTACTNRWTRLDIYSTQILIQFSKFAQNCPNLLKICQICSKLSKFAQNCPNLLKIVLSESDDPHQRGETIVRNFLHLRGGRL